jgi:hypothetical protein
MVVEMILSANASSKSAHRHLRFMSRSAFLLNTGLVKLIFFQLRSEGIHNIVTVPLGVESLRKTNGSDYAPTRHTYQLQHQSSHHAAATRGTHRDYVHTIHVSFDC